jgi:hypothetical protein
MEVRALVATKVLQVVDSKIRLQVKSRKPTVVAHPSIVRIARKRFSSAMQLFAVVSCNVSYSPSPLLYHCPTLYISLHPQPLPHSLSHSLSLSLSPRLSVPHPSPLSLSLSAFLSLLSFCMTAFDGTSKMSPSKSSEVGWSRSQ